MVERNKIYETKVKHSGVFDFREVYSFMYTLFTDMEYAVEEKTYSEKTKGDQKEIELYWIARRKVSDYFRFMIKADWRILRMTNAEVMRDGVKTSVNKGDFEMKIYCFLEKDYENRWENSPFLRFLRGIYDRYIIRSTFEEYQIQIEKETVDISDQLKAFLALTVPK